jgi:hypothetical protein
VHMLVWSVGVVVRLGGWERCGAGVMDSNG